MLLTAFKWTQKLFGKRGVEIGRRLSIWAFAEDFEELCFFWSEKYLKNHKKCLLVCIWVFGIVYSSLLVLVVSWWSFLVSFQEFGGSGVFILSFFLMFLFYFCF